MKWIKNTIIPFGRFKAMTIWPFVFYKGSEPSERTINHEAIHGEQQKEIILLLLIAMAIINFVAIPMDWPLLIPGILFYLVYGVEALIKGYRNISFEKEAYDNDQDKDYLRKRKSFAQWRKKK